MRLRGGAEALADVVRALDAAGLAVRDFQLHAPTLDDVFLSKTGRKLEEDDEAAQHERRRPRPAAVVL